MPQISFALPALYSCAPAISMKKLTPGLAVLGLRDNHQLLVTGVNPVGGNTHDDPVQPSTVGIIDAHDHVIRARFSQFEHILARRQDSILDLKRLTNGEMSLLVELIRSHGGRETRGEKA